ncbi:MAG: hypothetical protein FWH40_09575 [Coriobacteriia bacterium]|nr:hypothetical protein [Coriobacteriia bacterium]
MICRSCRRRIAKDSFSCPYCGSYQHGTDALDAAGTAAPSLMVEAGRAAKPATIVPTIVAYLIYVAAALTLVFLFHDAIIARFLGNPMNIPDDYLDITSDDQPPFGPFEDDGFYNSYNPYTVGPDYLLPEGSLVVPRGYKEVMTNDIYAIGTTMPYVGNSRRIGISFYVANRPDAYVTVTLADCTVNGLAYPDPDYFLGNAYIGPNSNGYVYLLLSPQLDLKDLSELRVTINIVDIETAEVYMAYSFAIDYADAGLEKEYTVKP